MAPGGIDACETRAGKDEGEENCTPQGGSRKAERTCEGQGTHQSACRQPYRAGKEGRSSEETRPSFACTRARTRGSSGNCFAAPCHRPEAQSPTPCHCIGF